MNCSTEQKNAAPSNTLGTGHDLTRCPWCSVITGHADGIHAAPGVSGDPFPHGQIHFLQARDAVFGGEVAARRDTWIDATHGSPPASPGLI